jgi:hypothetical protein
MQKAKDRTRKIKTTNKGLLLIHATIERIKSNMLSKQNTTTNTTSDNKLDIYNFKKYRTTHLYTQEPMIMQI